ncbi:integrase [Ammoniphilus oxalaticus]|uniref:Integrase n=1 Tax=Ammoniphilus oxalaticus TaxID=66863 RepID=A0A419SD98_9BACL|nr:tyrosine-type recombinase/integrase [Ammoniphilus oxalaticus]RKD21064.1 integrase [Ammoniphilus oxalaticus]
MISDYLNDLRQSGRSAHTVKAYERDLHHFFEESHLQPNDCITETDIHKWIRWMMRPTEGKPLAIATINRRLNALRGFYGWAVRNKKVSQNPMLDITYLKSADEDHEKIMWLTEEEFEDLLRRMRETPVRSRGVDFEEKYRRDRAIVYLFTYTGLRVEEVSHLNLTDLDLDMKRIRVLGKGQKARMIPISNTLFLELQDWLRFRAEIATKKEHVAESLYVFYSQRSSQFSIRGIQTMIEGYSTSEKKLSPHMFRHTFCKWMLKATGNDIEKVRRLVGHSNIATTSRYLKDSYEDLADAVDSLPCF